MKIIPIYFFLLIICHNHNYAQCSTESGLNSMTKKPTTSFLVGEYKLDDWTLKLMPDLKNANNTRLKINANGTVEITNSPIVIFDYAYKYRRITENINANGKWKLFYDKESAELITRLNFDEKFDSLNNIVTFWKIFKIDSKCVILISFGDPDECFAARFVKI